MKKVILVIIISLILLTGCASQNIATQQQSVVYPTTTIPVSDDEEWWYQLQCALSTPKLIHVSLGDKDGGQFTVDEHIYLKDFDDLIISEQDIGGRYYISGGLVRGAILSLPPGTYYHNLNSGVMYVTASDIASITNAKARYFKRLRYVLETPPDIEIRAYGITKKEYPITIGKNGSVLTYGASGTGFVCANVYYNGRTMNGLGLGSYNPELGSFNYVGNMQNTPLNQVPLSSDYTVTLKVIRNDEGVSYFKVHHCPDWW